MFLVVGVDGSQDDVDEYVEVDEHEDDEEDGVGSVQVVSRHPVSREEAF